MSHSRCPLSTSWSSAGVESPARAFNARHSSTDDTTVSCCSLSSHEMVKQCSAPYGLRKGTSISSALP
eukprot:5893571-Pleurochrysis_carterae.AAC.1